MEIYTDLQVEKFTRSLQRQAGTKIVRTIELLETFGHNLTMPHSKKVAKNLFELRIKGQQEIRIFFTFYDNAAHLLHCYVKKQQKIPEKELEQALRKLGLCHGKSIMSSLRQFKNVTLG
ncbi:MAG: type II toxin-antitoxin system RelE/ParE family toxin [Candidatus Doudnabacteria bacterium]|nr:type II toxin-antitoxin system RelE/ParE family toxin [Candidatus Doudnabacteria bacterium]